MTSSISLKAHGARPDRGLAVRELYMAGMTLSEARRTVDAAVGGARARASFRILGTDTEALAARLRPGGFCLTFEV